MSTVEELAVRPGTALPSRMEGRARLEAEKMLLKRYDAEYRRVAKNRGHIEAVKALVRSHGRIYSEMIRQALTRQRESLERASRAA
jgi:hypothetical protein